MMILANKNFFNKKFYIVLLAVSLFAAGVFYYGKITPKEKIKVKLGDKKIILEVAREQKDLQKGLSGRTRLSSNHGMIFVLPEAKRPVFWNRGMLIPIDILWFKGGKIVDIYENLPEEKYFGIISVVPKTESDMVIELSAGFSRANNVKIGDKITLNFE